MKAEKIKENNMYSKNVIFMDGEFTELNEKGTKFISIALIKPRVELKERGVGNYAKTIEWDEYYTINSEYNSKKCSEWVRENVLLPLYIQTVHGDQRNHYDEMNFHKIYGKSEKRIAEEIKQFVGNEKPYLVADVNQFDWMGICGLFGIYNIPFNYIPIDFASILWSKGIDPDIDRIELAKSMNIDVSNFKKHNALDDTRVLKSLYKKLS